MSEKYCRMIEWIHEYVTFVTSKNTEHWSRIQGFIHHLMQQRIPKRYSSKLMYACFSQKVKFIIHVQYHNTGTPIADRCLPGHRLFITDILSQYHCAY